MKERLGILVSGTVVILLLIDAGVNIFAPHLLAKEMEAVGMPSYHAPAIGGIIFVCTFLYTIPRTAFLGAIFVTGFLGGAICTHFRVGEVFSVPQVICILLAIATWGGLYLRDPRVRSIVTEPV